MRYYLLLLIMVTLISCKEKNSQKAAEARTPVSEKKYGTVEGREITEYTLSNAAGMEVSIINYGGTVTRIITPDKKGNKGDVVLGYDSLAGYLQKGNPYFGCLIGRYGNRIGGARFTLDGQTYMLAANNKGNSLHGGHKGFDKVVWTGEIMPGDTSIRLTYTSKDGEEGYPGNLKVTVIYTLTADNALKIEYAAETDKATPVNLTNHCYFNLSAGNDSTVRAHELMLNAGRFTEVDTALIPTGKLPDVAGTAMDFRNAKSIGKDLDSVKGGFDHNWVMNNNSAAQPQATLYHPVSGRFMEMFTTEPGIQFYSGNFLDGSLQHTKAGKKYVLHAGLCLEAQHFPDSPNQPSFPGTILKPGEKYSQTTIYKFSVK